VKRVKFYGDFFESDMELDYEGNSEDCVMEALNDIGWSTANLRHDNYLRSHKSVPKKLYYDLYSRYCSENNQINDGVIDFEREVVKAGIPDILAWKTENGFPLSPVFIEVKTRNESFQQSQYKWFLEHQAFDIALAVVEEVN